MQSIKAGDANTALHPQHIFLNYVPYLIRISRASDRRKSGKVLQMLNFEGGMV